MPAFRPNSLALILVCLILALAASAQDLHFKRNVSVGGNAVASSEVWVKGARERSATSTSAGSMVSLRQCDLKRTVTINDQGQTYLVMNDPQDDSAAKAAAMFGGAPQPAQTSGGTITQTVSVVDTGEHKVISGYAARHLKTTVSIEPSANACSQTKQKFDIDGWYTDVIKEQTTCAIALPPTNGAENCSDRVILHRKGTARPGYPLLQAITIHNDDGSSTKVEISATEISKDTLKSDLFDVPAGYREVKSNAELYAAAIPQTPAGSMPSGQQFAPANGGMSAGSQFPNMAAQMGGQNAMMSQMGSMPGMQQGMAGMSGSASGAGVPLPQALGPKAPGRIRIGIAPAQAQLGQGNNAQADYATPIRNAMIFMMAGPAVEIAALDSRIPIQLQAEAQQKQCDYVLMSGVTVKHSSSGFGKFMKAGSMASNMTPVGMMAHSMTAMAASQAAAQAAAMTAQQQAVSQLSQFNGQIKSKDDVTVDYQLYPTGQPQPKLQNSLKGKAKADGEDVLTPLIQQAATNILTEVTKK